MQVQAIMRARRAVIVISKGGRGIALGQCSIIQRSAGVVKALEVIPWSVKPRYFATANIAGGMGQHRCEMTRAASYSTKKLR
jgi:hypothetical protein